MYVLIGTVFRFYFVLEFIVFPRFKLRAHSTFFS